MAPHARAHALSLSSIKPLRIFKFHDVTSLSRWRFEAATWLFIVSCFGVILGESQLPSPLDIATDFTFTGFGFGPCTNCGVLGALPTVRYVPPQHARKIEDPSGVMMPMSSYSMSGKPCSLASGIEMYLDAVQPPEQLNVSEPSAFEVHLSPLSSSRALKYIYVMQSSYPEGGPNCGPPAGRNGRILIRSAVHFEVVREWEMWSPDRRVMIYLLPGVRYIAMYVSFVDQLEGLAFCVFRTLSSESSKTPSSSEQGNPPIESERPSGVGKGAIIAIVAAGMIVLISVAALVFVRRRSSGGVGILMQRERSGSCEAQGSWESSNELGEESRQ